MKKKSFYHTLIAMTIAVSAALAGCSSGQDASTSAGQAGGTAEAGKTGGTLVIARLSDANNLDPHFLSQIPSAAIVHHKVYEGLVRMDKESKYVPSLASEWKQLDDLTWEFKLRQGVTFHDGAPFNAEAVKATIARVQDPAVGSSRINMFEAIKEVKVVDEYTVQFLLNYPYAPLLSVLASAEGSIISPKAIEQYGKDLSKHPTGTGPYKFEKWTPGQEVVLVRNDTYYGGTPNLDKVVFKTVPEDTTRLAMVETGEVQVAENLPVTDIDRVQNSPSMQLGRYPGFSVDHIGLNTKKKPFDDVRVRQAIAHAIDKKTIIEGVYNSVGTPAHSSITPAMVGYSPNVKDIPYDVEKAKQLLAEAGYPNGFKAKIALNDNKARISVAEVLQQQLKPIGIDLQLDVMEFGAYIEAASKGETDLFMSGWGNATGDPDYNQANLYHSKAHGAPGNHSFYNNPEVDKLIDEGRRETDPEKRKKLYEKAQQIEMNEAPLIPFRFSENLAAIQKNVQGVWISPAGHIEIDGVTIQ
ncbi:glutathione ABC transporter substrate-binding protein [Brevibacillus brevis]|uniref:Glutathione ABC transporter substrate-binding protein n=1 Tax=Brevibacillus brevis TaxID=1393 RepID=A0A517I5X1_BREBE|nr:glutathione ABC transporter substrate-binding protein [Brevibacillus brevis]QDS34275.1 glutathione ABC transporter substrate-binding protein [Brevibacillus brevis]